MRKMVNKQRYCGQYAVFGEMYKFQPDESEQCYNITMLGFAIQPSPDQAERQPLSSNNHECNY